MTVDNTLTAIGLFAGCGGFDLGASHAGFTLVGAYDSDPIAIETYRRHVSPHAEVCDLAHEDVTRLPKRIDLVIGGPPCQGFSSAGSKTHDDKRNFLWTAYLRVIAHVRPKAFVFENVYGFVREYEAFSTALTRELDDEYAFSYRRMNAEYYGVPQARRRLFIVGIRRDISTRVPWPKPLIPEISNQRKEGGWNVVPGMISMDTALADLGPATASSNLHERIWGNPHEYVELERTHALIAPHVPNGGSLRRIPNAHLPQTYQGRRVTHTGWPWYYRKPDPRFPGRTVTALIGPTYSEILAPDVVPVYVGNRWRWDVVDPVEHTAADGLYTSPVAQRRLTVRECARLQTFPDEFEFFGTMKEKHRQIGNAVPVDLARLLCSAVADALNGRGPTEDLKGQVRLWA